MMQQQTVTKAPSPGLLQGQGVQLPPEVMQGGPLAIHNGYVRVRDQLRDQLERLEEQRSDLAGQLENPHSAANARGIEARIAAVDARIANVDRQLEQVDAAVARTAAVAGTSVPSREDIPPPPGGFPEELIAIPALFIIFVLFPLTLAYTRRIWRRSGQVGSGIPQNIEERLSRMDQNIDTIALEVERIGESQRYLTKQYAERGLGAGAAQPVEFGEREKLRDRK